MLLEEAEAKMREAEARQREAEEEERMVREREQLNYNIVSQYQVADETQNLEHICTQVLNHGRRRSDFDFDIDIGYVILSWIFCAGLMRRLRSWGRSKGLS